MSPILHVANTTTTYADVFRAGEQRDKSIHPHAPATGGREAHLKSTAVRLVDDVGLGVPCTGTGSLRRKPGSLFRWVVQFGVRVREFDTCYKQLKACRGSRLAQHTHARTHTHTHTEW